VSRRDQIRMSGGEIAAFLDEERIVTLATNGRDGWPHLMPLWYVVLDGVIWSWTYAKSQKVRNLERDPRCTLQIEAGRDVYGQLRGVMLKAEAVIHRDLDTVAPIGAALAERYGGRQATPEVISGMRAQAAKRVGLEFRVVRGTDWDHRKLAGTY
jgi:PPOX class probable F420-dependent enzyme